MRPMFHVEHQVQDASKQCFAWNIEIWFHVEHQAQDESKPGAGLYLHAWFLLQEPIELIVDRFYGFWRRLCAMFQPFRG